VIELEEVMPLRTSVLVKPLILILDASVSILAVLLPTASLIVAVILPFSDVIAVIVLPLSSARSSASAMLPSTTVTAVIKPLASTTSTATCLSVAIVCVPPVASRALIFLSISSVLFYRYSRPRDSEKSPLSAHR
jgi:hypothetical protein